MNNKQSGIIAEFLARLYLRCKGYHILYKNKKRLYKTSAGEVDFIALKKHTLVFVEVKKRKTIEQARYAIKPTQQKRIISAAKLFMKQHPMYQTFNIRFDAVLVKFPFYIVHIKNAWSE